MMRGNCACQFEGNFPCYTVEEDDYLRWELEDRHDILQWVTLLQPDGCSEVLAFDVWIDPVSRSEVQVCPWFIEMKDQEGNPFHHCKIHLTKPWECRHVEYEKDKHDISLSLYDFGPHDILRWDAEGREDIFEEVKYCPVEEDLETGEVTGGGYWLEDGPARTIVRKAQTCPWFKTEGENGGTVCRCAIEETKPLGCRNSTSDNHTHCSTVEITLTRPTESTMTL